ncbi:MAG: S-methyl-5-thioribose-1-phosphate isomerase [Thermodesulfobacteriota bacterium]
MNVNGKPTRGIWHEGAPARVRIIDQRWLPHRFETTDLATVDQVIKAIQVMAVRGAPLIGATGAYGVYVALRNVNECKDLNAHIREQCRAIAEARPTAVNLAWAVNEVEKRIAGEKGLEQKTRAALEAASGIADAEADRCRAIGRHGLPLIREIFERVQRPVNILTHCNAGWLACVDVGTATAPIYAAHEAGIPVHVWVDETRPLNQGARLTAWELLQQGVPHTVVVDNAGGHLMQKGQVDMCIVGSDRTTTTGDVANKIGTYLKALAARDNNIPFYAALPSSTIDWQIDDGNMIPVEERNPDEVRQVFGTDGVCLTEVLVAPEKSPALNPAFDVTPSRLVTGLITERGVCPADALSIKKLFPEKF